MCKHEKLALATCNWKVMEMNYGKMWITTLPIILRCNKILKHGIHHPLQMTHPHDGPAICVNFGTDLPSCNRQRVNIGGTVFCPQLYPEFL